MAKLDNDAYAQLAESYEFLNPRETARSHAPFLIEIINHYGISSVLDCACGNGWHLEFLHECGLTCAGSDNSPAMLALAQRNLKHLKERQIPLKKEDFRSLTRSWKRTFDMVLCLTTSLPHVRTEQEVIKALSSMYKVLNKGGVLIISNGISDKMLDEQVLHIPGRVTAKESMQFFLSYPCAEEVVFSILHSKVEKSALRQQVHTMRYSAMRKSFLDRCFKKTKFKNVAYFGTYDLTPYSVKESSRLIAIAQK